MAIAPDMLPALLLLSACATQWRRAGWSGRVTGLDYAAVRLVAEIQGQRLTKELLDDLRHVEAGVLEELSVMAERQKGHRADGR